MKLAVISDIHGNIPALERVLEDIEQWGADQVVVNGDLINRGANSLNALQLLRHHHPEAPILQGNHEGFVLYCAEQPYQGDEPKSQVRRFAHFTVEQMGEQLSEVARWDDHLDLTDLDGGTFHITHASRLGNRDGILPDTPDAELQEKIGDPRDLFITSHTHRPLQRNFNGTLVVNTGSVGSPFDRDPRACYGRFSFSRGRWQAQIRRLDYDRDRAEEDFERSGFLDRGGPLARIMLEELRLSRGLMGPWMRLYHQAVLDRELTIEESVERHLAEYGG